MDRKRYEAAIPFLPQVYLRPAAALRDALKTGYGGRELRRDVLSGLVVGVVALPLSMALAIATGVPPQHGIYTAIVAGMVIAVLGGSKVQVSGPTAAFVVILAPITAQFGLAGLAVASAMAGVLLCAMGLLRLGRLIEFIPYPVTTGFTAGIAVVIATLQLKDFFGLQTGPMPEHYLEKVATLAEAFRHKFLGGGLGTASFADVAVGAVTLAILLVWPRVTKRIPAALVALPVAAIGAWAAERLSHGALRVETIMSRFGSPASPSGIPSQLPSFVLPWTEAGPGGAPLTLDFATLRGLLVPALAIAMLGAIESLLSAVVSDGMIGDKHDPDAELFAQGVGNITAPFFGGFAATGAIARTATNVRAGGRSPVASMVHGLFLLLAVLALAPLLGYLPMAAMAALLLVVAKNMAEVKHFAFVVRYAPRSDVAVLLACFGLTVIFDMVLAVGVGVVLAALLFMREMAEVASVRLAGADHPALRHPVPSGVVLYQIGGPLFFGAAQRALSALGRSDNIRAAVLDLDAVPTIDATGLVTLDSAITRLQQQGAFVVLSGLREQPLRVIEKAGWLERPAIAVAGEAGAGIEIARAYLDAA